MLKCFDGTTSPGRLVVRARSDANGRSFAGAAYPTPRTTRVVITTGDAPLGRGVRDVSAGGSADLVMIIDCIHGKPRPL